MEAISLAIDSVVSGEPGPQPLLAVHGSDNVQWHHRYQPQIRVIGGMAAASCLAGRARAGTIRVAAFTVSRMPEPDQLAPRHRGSGSRPPRPRAWRTGHRAPDGPGNWRRTAPGGPARPGKARTGPGVRAVPSPSGGQLTAQGSELVVSMGFSHDVCSWLASYPAGTICARLRALT